jgi:hypothetical protein
MNFAFTFLSNFRLNVASHYQRPMVFFFFGKFLQPNDKKKGFANPTKGILKRSPYLDQKNLEITRFRYCVPISR